MTLLETVLVCALVVVLLAMTIPTSKVPPVWHHQPAMAACRVALDAHVASEYHRTLRWPENVPVFWLAREANGTRTFHTKPDLLGMYRADGISWGAIIVSTCEVDANDVVLRVGIPL